MAPGASAAEQDAASVFELAQADRSRAKSQRYQSHDFSGRQDFRRERPTIFAFCEEWEILARRPLAIGYISPVALRSGQVQWLESADPLPLVNPEELQLHFH